jgi:hypothetical protein
LTICDITGKDDKTRTDGRYPLRIGSKVKFAYCLTKGACMLLDYIEDNQGNPKSGHLRTSIVESFKETENEIVVTTRNSIYYFKKEKYHQITMDEYLESLQIDGE